ncbi:MAG: hypothetical protein V3R24_04260 [Gemmatimonadales bacterium]
MPHRRRVFLFAGFLSLRTAVLPLNAQQAAHSAESTVNSVEIITHNVFREDEARSNFIFRLANAVRFKTRTSVVRRELLFEPGDRYDSASVVETERNLRGLDIFRHVSVDSVRSDSRLILRVETEDAWSTKLQTNARSTGGTFTMELALADENFLGTGNVISVAYRDEPDRTAVTFSGLMRRAFGSRVRISGLFDDLSDGNVGVWRVGVPFQSLSDRQSFEIWGIAATRRVLQFRDGVTFDSLQHRVFRNNLVYIHALRASSRGYMRVGFVTQIRREEFVSFQDTSFAVPDSLTASVGAFFEWRAARFLVVTHYNGFSREEDIDLSTRIRIGAWVAPSGFGYERSGVGPLLDAQTGFVFGKNFGRIRVRVNGLLTATTLDSGTVVATMTIGSRIIPRQATVLHLEGGSRRGTPFGFEFDLGHGLGPRAFEPHAFTGERMVWGVLEHRMFLVDEFVGLFGLGVAGFLDYGGAWFSDQPTRFGGDVGVGLRLGTTRSTSNNLGRLDVAYRFGDGFVGNRWVFSFGRAFDF